MPGAQLTQQQELQARQHRVQAATSRSPGSRAKARASQGLTAAPRPCRLSRCTPQNLSNFVWAVVEQGLPLPEGAWDQVARQAVLLMPSANAQSVAVLCRGVGRQGLE